MRTVFSYLQDKAAVNELFTVISSKIADRPGGYTRIIKVGNRLGDNAAMCFIELVDFNENMLKVKKTAAKTRRSRKKATGTESSPAATATATATAAEVEQAVEEPVVEAVTETPAPEEQKAE